MFQMCGVFAEFERSRIRERLPFLRLHDGHVWRHTVGASAGGSKAAGTNMTVGSKATPKGMKISRQGA